MRQYSKKIIGFLLFMTAGVMMHGFADQKPDQSQMIADYSHFGAKPTLSSAAEPAQANGKNQQVSEQNVFGNWQGKSGGASVNSGFTISAAFLYLQAQEEGLLYAETVSVVPPATSAGTLFIDAKQRELDFEWAPGAQVSLGYIFPQRQQWETTLTWSYLHSKAHDSAKTDPNALTTHFLKPYFLPFLTGSNADRSSAHWTLNFNTLDLMLSRNYFAGKYLAVKPTVGVRGAWIDQHFLAKYHGLHIGNQVFYRNTSFKNKTDFSGGGIRVGTDLQWFMSSQWSLLGSFSGSLVYGHFRVREKVDGMLLTSPDTAPHAINKTKNNQNRLSPNLEGKLGIQWQTFFNSDKYKVSLGAYYMLAYWFNQNKIFNATNSMQFSAIENLSTPIPQTGNLQLQGGNFELRFEF